MHFYFSCVYKRFLTSIDLSLFVYLLFEVFPQFYTNYFLWVVNY